MLQQLIDDLARPEAYPHPVDGPVVVRQTHISAVFLAGNLAYKVKKPLNLGFLDFRDLARRQHFCREEVRLNRRLAPDVYLDVVPLTLAGGHFVVDGSGEAVEYAVKMRRLPDEATLAAELDRGSLDGATMAEVGRRLARFHAAADQGPDVARWAAFDTVAFNARENFEQLRPYLGRSLDPAVHARLAALTEQRLADLRGLIEDRAGHGVPRDTHGDLRLDHIYRLSGRPAPDDLVIIDCIEFNERFRFADPVCDLAFLTMDLRFRHQAELAAALEAAWFEVSEDTAGRELLGFYEAYRAVVRAKVGSMALDEPEIPVAQRTAEAERARAHGLLALGTLAPPSERPALVLVAGLPGTGKSRLATALADRAGFAVVATDPTRKALAGVAWGPGVPATDNPELYTPAWDERTYAACLAQSEAQLLAGERVIVDATFRSRKRRAQFLDLAQRLRLPALVLVCQAPPGTVRERLASRSGDASDATWPVYQRLARFWEAPGSGEPARDIDASGSIASMVDQASAALEATRLL